jgi:phage terminase small subunit
MSKLTPNQQRFIDEYLVDLNATQAAIRAGYSEKTAEQQGSRLLRNAQVAEAVAAGKAARASETGITQDRVLTELQSLAFSCIDHYMLNEQGRLVAAPGAPANAMAAVSSVKYKTTTVGVGEAAKVLYECEFKLWDKPGTLKLAGRHVGLFPDKVDRAIEGVETLAGLLNTALKERAS